MRPGMQPTRVTFTESGPNINCDAFGVPHHAPRTGRDISQINNLASLDFQIFTKFRYSGFSSISKISPDPKKLKLTNEPGPGSMGSYSSGVDGRTERH